MKYLIQVLDAEAFDKLNYKYVETAVGITDTNKKRIYIRNMGNNTLNHNIIEHELDEAGGNYFEGHEPSDERGIRYKSFMRSFGKTFVGRYVVPAALFAIPGVGPALAATYSAVNAYQKESTPRAAIMGGIEGLAAGVGGQGVIGGVKAGLAAGAKGGLMAGAKAVLPGMAAGAKAGLIALPGITPGMFGGTAASGIAGAGTSTLYGGAAPTATGIGTTFSGNAALGTGFTSGIGAGASPMAMAGLPNLGQAAAPAAAKFSLGKTLAGFGIAGLGQGLVKTPTMPESGEVNRLKGMMSETGTISPIGSLGLEKLTGRLGESWKGLPEDYKTAIKADYAQPYEDAKRNLTNQYKALRPGMDIENDSAFRKDMSRLEGDFADRISNRMVQLEQQERTNYLNRQAQDIQQALNLDQQTFQNYTEMAQLDLDKIMMKYGLDYATASQFKSIFGNFGSLLAQSGMGMNNPFSGFSLN